MSVRVRYYPSPFDPELSELYEVPWTPGLTVEDCVRQRLPNLPPVLAYKCSEPLELTQQLADRDTFAMCVRPGPGLAYAAGAFAGGGGGGLFASLAGWWSGSAVGQFFAAHTFLGQVALSAGLYAAGRLLAQPARGKARGDEESPAYGFGGPGNIRVEGQPIPIIFGRFRYPGMILQEFTRTRTNPPRTDYYALVCYGHGPIESISGVSTDTVRTTPIKSGDAGFPVGLQINGNDAANLDGITVAVRLGTPTQDLASGPGLPFEDTQQRFELSNVLDSVETTGQDNSVRVFDNSNYTGATADTHFATYGEAYSFDEDYDGFRVLVSWPSGLYRINITGNVQPSYGDFALRYIELDGGGSPITTGGPESDGYVRLPLEERVQSSHRSPFSVEFEHPFYDPQTYSHPSGGRALVLDGTNDYASVATPTIPSAWAGAAIIDEMSAFCWFNADTLPNTDHVLMAWTTGNRGFTLRIKTVSIGPASLLVPVVSLGDGSAFVDYNGNGASVVDAGVWRMVSFAYKRVGFANHLTIWFGNSVVFSTTNAVGFQSAGTSTFYLGRTTAGGSFFDGRIDEAEWIHKAFTQTDIATRWATGIGFYVGPTAQHVGLWHFDTDSATDPTPDDSSASANHLTLTNGASIPSGANGKVLGPPSSSNVVKRGRYKVELVRVNQDSTHVNVSDDAQWNEVVGVFEHEFSYPSLALIALGAQASEQLNSTIPTTTDLIKGLLVPHWDQLSQQFPTFDRQWSRNPAWIALFIVLDPAIGLGRQFKATDLDVQSFQDLADYAAERIYDHQGTFEATADWDDITYTGSAGVGTLTIQFDSAAYSLLRWSVGDFLGFSGVPVVDEDINNPAPSGYEITAMDSAAFTVTVDVSLPSDPWTSGTLLSAHDTVTGEIEGREPRYTFDGAFDTEGGAWEALMSVLAVARAMPIRSGKKIRVVFERPRTRVDIFGQGSIAAGSWQVNYGGRKNRANSLTAEFQDEDQNHDRATVSLDSQEIQDATALDGIRRETVSLFGCCRRAQALRQCAYLLNVNSTLVREGSFISSREAIHLEVGDVIGVAHDVQGWSESSRIYATNTTSAIKLGQTVVLAGATTYELSIRNPSTGLVETQTVSSGAGTYALGTAISVASPFSFTPARDDVYILSIAGEMQDVQITGITLTQDLQRQIDWIEYAASVYTDDWFGDISAPTPSSGSSPNPLLAPTDPNDVQVVERVVRGPGDNYETHLQVSWVHDETSAEFIESTALWLSLDDGPFDEVAIVGGKATSADVKIDRLLAGSVATVAVQPRTSKGVRRRPGACANATTVLYGIAMAPNAPEDLAGRMDGELCAYSFTSNDKTAAHEIRRGGWILGDPIANVSPGQASTPSIANWASSFLLTDPPIYARALNSAGFYSEADLLEASLTPPGARTVPAWITAGNVNWRSYEDGWRTDTSPPAGDPVLTGFDVVDDAVHGDYLVFDGSALEATYETAYTAPSAEPAIRAFVEAWVIAEQVHPLPIDEWTWGIGDPAYSRWTLEGPTTLLEGETENCTLRIQIQVDEGSGFGDWQDVRCGAIYSLRDAKFRLYATRPSTDYDVRIHHFVTRIRQQAYAATDSY